MNIKAMATVALAGGLAVSLSACGSSSGAKTAANGYQNGYGNRAGGGGGIPGTSGLVAAVSGSTAQVQSTSAQTAVSWNSTTTFTDEVKVTKAAVKVGDCVQAARATSAASSSTSTTLAAATVRITSTSGGCSTLRPNAGSAPSGAPTAFPGGQNGTRPRTFGNIATIGVVTSVSSSGFVVKPAAFRTSSTSPVTVTTSSSTTYLQTQKASASAVKVGICLSANGSTDSTGAVTAKRITLSQPTNGVCTQTRFGGGFPGGGPGGGFPGGGQGAPQNG